MPSFDMVYEASMVEMRDAVEQANEEISTRFGLKSSDSRVEHKEQELALFAGDDFKIGQVNDVLMNRSAKRNVDVCFLDYQDKRKIGDNKMKQVVKIRKGVSGDLTKKIIKTIKNSKIEVQVGIQSGVVRVTDTKRDDLQSMIAALRKDMSDIPLGFNNFCD